MRCSFPVILAASAFLGACKDGSPAVMQPQVEAGAAVADGLCSLLEGVDDSGVLRTICATVEEIAQIASFILTLRTAQDGGAPSAMTSCTPLPSTTLCATRPEIAKGILFVSKLRERRLMRDAGGLP